MVNEGDPPIMVPNHASASSATVTEPAQPLMRNLPCYPQSTTADRSLLAPADAIYQDSPPRKSSASCKAEKNSRLAHDAVAGDMTPLSMRGRQKDRNRSGSRRRKGTWKKLLWVKQSYPDNYTDQDTFLEHLQRNPRLQPYDFWPLVADSTVIVQHVCSVIIFVVCFVGIFQEHISPISVVGWGSIATFLGWVLWDWWVGLEDPVSEANAAEHTQGASASSSVTNLPNDIPGRHSHLASPSASSTHSPAPATCPTPTSDRVTQAHHSYHQLSHRTSLRLSTAKSALLIYFTLLGLSPILKSLTRSTSSDSIWAMSFLLFMVNIFFFDYGTPPPSTSGSAMNKNIPASLSTNAALMASTVLASRLPSTEQVFSLTLFSIEVFGLFPVFRRYLRQWSWRGHVFLTIFLILGAGGGVGLILGRGGDREGFGGLPFKSTCIGVVAGVVLTAIAMGGCSWWLIGLQKYKNEIHGPWDPARPIIRRAWGEVY